MKNIGLILFDIDGVIRSVENSYRLALMKTVYKFSGWEPSYKDIDNAKNEGIWNNDWDLSLELIKRCIKSRHGDTPVLIARQVGRENQSKKFFTLNTIPFKQIDMLSIIIIGNSQTTLVDEIFLTPRGYLQK